MSTTPRTHSVFEFREACVTPMTTHYSLVKGELRISCDEPPFEWQGQVDSMPVIGVYALPGSSAVLLLLDAPPARGVSRTS